MPEPTPKPACGFCQGRPVMDGRAWQDGKPRPALACPRCGEVNEPKRAAP